MLKKVYRLDKKEFTSAFQKGKAFNLPHFVIKYKPSRQTHARFGISCGLRVSKKATVRNRMKRRIAESLRQHFSTFLPGDYVIVVKPSIGKESFSYAQDELIQALLSLNEKNRSVSH